MKEKLFIYLKVKGEDLEVFDIQEEVCNKLLNDFPWLEIEKIENYKELALRIDEPTYLLTWIFKKEWYFKALALKAIYTPAAGHDWVPSDPNGKVKNYYGTFHGTMMVETLFTFLFYFQRRLNQVLSNQKKQNWVRDLQKETTLLKNQKMLIVGYGHIGKICADKLKIFGLKMFGLQRQHYYGHDKNGVEYVTIEKIEEILPIVDHVLLLLPKNESSENLFTEDYFGLMKKSAYLYNLGRGNCYHEQDLIWALKNKKLAGAGLDVFATEPLQKDSKLWSFDNVIITPHSSCVYKDYALEFYNEFKDNFRHNI